MVFVSLSVVSSTVAHVLAGFGGRLTDESRFAAQSEALAGLAGLLGGLCALLGLAMNCMGFVTGLYGLAGRLPLPFTGLCGRAGLLLGLEEAFMTCGLTNCSGCGLKGLVARGSAALLVGLDSRSGFVALRSST